MQDPVSVILPLYRRIADLTNAASLLEWDQETYMPDGAAESRAHQIGSLRSIAHDLATSDELGRALAALTDFASANPDDAMAGPLLRVGLRDYELATKLPTEFVGRSARTEARAKNAWRLAREQDDYTLFADDLSAVVELNREKAELLGYSDHPYDALLDQFEPGARTADIDAVFQQLRSELVPMVAALRKKADGRGDLLRQAFDPQVQWDTGESLLRHIGFDFNAGRQDRSSHPFCTTFSISDVRITTRIDPGCFSPGFYGTLHEMGHGLYEQGIDPDLERTPLADGTTLGVHESQSRLWENLVGRSREFVEFHFPRLKQSFPSQFGAASAESFYRAINAVEPSLIRVEADEVTYNLHVMVRFEIERALFENRIQVNHLPETWNDLMEEYLGIRPTSDSDGVLQDIHWSMGAFGYFPTYAIGNLMASQFFAAAEAQLGDLPAQISRGEFEPLVRWLRENIHRHGRRRSANELLLDVTGGALSAAPWLEYIRRKYSELYEVDLDALAD